MPSETPLRGSHPPRNVVVGQSRPMTLSSRAPTNTTPPAEVTIATMSSRRRESGSEAAKRAATRNGPATTRGASFSTSVAQGVELVGVERAEALLGLHGDRQQQRGDRGADHDVGQRQRLDHRIDRL